MPKILIKEVDLTKAGGPGEYSNHAVLLVGYGPEVVNQKAPVQPDDNGVYNFTDAADFVATIGKFPAKKEESVVTIIDDNGKIIKTETKIISEHYGNQMAYELLKMGYPVSYKVIQSPKELVDSKFWDIFKDKASYDFRFISHGLLCTSDDSIPVIKKINALQERQQQIEIAIKELKLIEEDYAANNISCNKLYLKFLANLIGLKYDPEDEKASNPLFAKDIAVPTLNTEIYNKICKALMEQYPGLLTIAHTKGVNESVRDLDFNAYVNASDSKYISRFYRIGYKDTDENTQYVDISSVFPLNYDNAKAYLTGGDMDLVGMNETTNPVTVEGEQAQLGKVIDEIIAASKGEDSTSPIKFAILASDFAAINANIANLATYVVADETSKDLPGRGDCTALIELDANVYKNKNKLESVETCIIKGINRLSDINASNGKFCAMTLPCVTYVMNPDIDYKDNTTFPGAFHYLACYINSIQLGFSEWYAAAGYTRGLSSYVIDKTAVKLGELAINALEPRFVTDPVANCPKFACNVIANFRGSYYLWGNRTAHPLGKYGTSTGNLVASSFLNIRQLCSTIKKQLYVACRRFTFDPNSDTLWFNFVNSIKPTLERMKADQGIRDYKIIKEFTDKKATLKARVRIIPIEAVEDFDLTISLEDSFGETTADITE